MNKKSKKILISILLIVLLLFCFSQTIFADWEPNFKKLSNGTVNKAGGMAINVLGSIINAAQVIGMGIAIIVLVIIGIQYVTSSPSGKAEIKNKATNYIIGAVLIFSAAAILQIVKLFVVDNVKYE